MNKVWGGIILIALISALFRYLGGDTTVLNAMNEATFSTAKLAVEIAIGLIGLLALWSGLFHAAEKAGLVQLMSRAIAPLLCRLMPEVPRNHPAQGAVTMNLAANMLGLDVVATPMGLKAMEALQSLNPLKHTASNAQILFLVLNTSSVTLLPVTIFMYRAQMGAADPSDVFIPILLATTASSMAGLLSVMWLQRIAIDRVVAAYLFGFSALMTTFISYLSQLSSSQLSQFSQDLAHSCLLSLVAVFIGYGLYKKSDIYEDFIEGAKTGFSTAVMLIPYLVAMLFAIGLLRASGAIDAVLDTVKMALQGILSDTRFVDALPVAIMKPLSGSGARGMMLEAFNTYGVDSFVGRLASIMQGSTETTFYVLTVYFGAVGITRIRYALWAGLLCDVVGMTSAIFIGYWFFG